MDQKHLSNQLKYSKQYLNVICFILLNILAVTSQKIIETLPGYPGGVLPFKLETGYIGVGENESIQLFYYFVESERNPDKDPLVLWLNGGPGCSAFSGLVYEIGPLAFDIANFDGSFPSFLINAYSWTKVASIIFIDAPVGTGFSYSNTSEGYPTSDTKSTTDNYTFLRKWLLNHPKFIKNWMYVAGDSYGGKIVPMVALEIAKGNEAALKPHINLQGYIVGNPVTDLDKETNERIPYYHRMALISDKYYEHAKISCKGEYVNTDPNNIACTYALQLINQCVKGISTAHILEPKCKNLSPKPDGNRWDQTFLEDYPVNFLYLSGQEKLWCRNQNYVTSYVWANNQTVQEALGIREGTKGDWVRYNKSLSYEFDMESVFEHHRLLSEKGYQALAYSGDHDPIVPYMSTLKWIHELNLTMDDNWRPWYVDGQVAGYTEKYKNNEAYITFATVKGAGHTAPEYNPKQCFAMINRWLSLYDL